MSNNLTIPTRFEAVDGMSAPLNKMSAAASGMFGKFERFSGASNRLFNKLVPGLSDATKHMLEYAKTAALAGGAFAVGQFSVDAIKDYETATKSLEAVTGVTFDKFKKDIQELGKQSGKSFTEVAGSFEIIGSAMSQYLDDPKSLRAIADAGIMLSKASRMELEPSLDALTSVMNQFSLGADKAADTVQRLTAGEIVGAVRTSEAAEMLKEFGAVASNMNVSVTESVALIEALGMQMDKSKIGVGARNLLTIISSAKGLDKQARKALKGAGVDMGLLMNNSKSLSERLHELSKIANSPVKMVKVFGKENLTAANVIFKQLATYDQFAGKISTTNEAQNQAATNSDTLAIKLDELKNAWANMLNSSSQTSEGLQKVKSVVQDITDNLDSYLATGLNVLKFMAVWKVANIAMSTVTKAHSIYLGIQNTLTLSSTAAIEGNIIAMRSAVIAEKAMAAGIALSSGNLAAFSAALGLTPFGWAVIGAAGLAAAIYGISKAQEQANEEYIAARNIRFEDTLRRQRQESELLTKQFQAQGKSLRDSVGLQLSQQRLTLSGKLADSKRKLDQNEQAMTDFWNNNTWNPFANLSDEFKRLQDEKQAINEDITNTSGALTQNTKQTITARNTGLLSNADFLNIIRGKQYVQKDVATDPGKNWLKPSDTNFVNMVNPGAAAKGGSSDLKVTIDNKSDNPAQAKLNDTASRDIRPGIQSTLRAAF